MTAAFESKRALVVGGGAGIGRAIAEALCQAGAKVAIVARTAATLEPLAAAMGVSALPADLSTPEAASRLAHRARAVLGGVDILVLSSGEHLTGAVGEVTSEAFIDHLASNLIGPAALVRALTPDLAAGRGDILFVNSSVVRAANLKGRTHYAAGKHALKAFADGLRDEVNEMSVRVTSLYPGTTATPRQDRLQAGNAAYRPDRLLQAADVAQAALTCLALGPTAEVTDLYIRPRYKS